MSGVAAVQPDADASTEVGNRAQTRVFVDWVTPALAIVFLASGASGLIYQIAWVRLLALTFGVTIYAVSAVVAMFMGGLALGSFLGGRLADRVGRPLVWYAVAEGMIAAAGLLSLTALSWVQAAYVAVLPREASEVEAGVVALRIALAAGVLLVPTTLMGATLPLIVKGSRGMSEIIGSRVSWLYAANTAGAILGTLLAGFVLIGGIGITATITAAAALNLAAALAALLLSAALRPGRNRTLTEGLRGKAIPSETHADAPSSLVRRLVILAFSVQGFTSLAYEVIWIRVLAIILDGTTYAFSLVLATVLLGIALGSALVGPFMTRRLLWVKIYALIQAGVAALVLVGIAVFANIYGIMSWLDEAAVLQPVLASDFSWMTTVAVLAILPPMLLLGASFPIAVRIVTFDTTNAGRDLGMLYAGNTAGAILGVCVAGFVLIPAMGTQLSIQGVAAVNAALAIAVAMASGPGAGRLATTLGALMVASLASAHLLAPSMYTRIVADRFPGRDILWVGEGHESSVAVLRRQTTGEINLFLNGQHQASDSEGVVAFHRLIGQLPMVLHPDPRDVLVVGLGGGSTAGGIARHEPQRIDVVELSTSVVAAARYFGHVNGNVHDAPSIRLKIDDGRNHLLVSGRKYDLITADVIHPRNAGSAVLYSREYYDLARRALKPGGLISQWLEDDPDSPDNDVQRKLMARTFLQSLPHVTMWAGGSLLISSNEPIDADLERIMLEWDRRRLGALLAGTGFDSPEAFRSLYVMGDAELRAWAGRGPIVTDDQPIVEYYLSLPGHTAAPGWSRSSP